MTYFYIHENVRIMKARWQEGLYLAYVRRKSGNYFKKRKDAVRMLNKIKKLYAKASTKKRLS